MYACSLVVFYPLSHLVYFIATPPMLLHQTLRFHNKNAERVDMKPPVCPQYLTGIAHKITKVGVRELLET